MASFICGCVGGYLTFCSAGALAMLLQPGSHLIYGGTGLILIGAGIRTLLTVDACREFDGSRHDARSLGAPFLAGVCCSVFGSPCCAPVALALGFQAAQHDVGFGAATLLAFGTGHMVPVSALVAMARTPFRCRAYVPPGAAATVSGTLLAAVGALYAVLA